VVYVEEPVIFDTNTITYTAYDVAPLIESYTSQGIVVLFDIHDHIGHYFEGQDLVDYLTFIKDFSNKYKDNPYVWLDVHNEPGTYDGVNQDFTKWRTEITTIMDTVRAIAPEMIALIPGAAWGQDTGPQWNSNNILAAESALLANSDIIDNYQNVIATFHMYDQWVYGGLPRLQNFVDQLDATLNIPIIVGEYGSNNINSTIQATQNLHTLLQLPGYENIGRIAWTWDANDSNDLTTDQSGGGLWVDSCDNPTNLTPFGQLVWDDNH
jgi:mannan endo-1,4-beta-mannosidase